jgi:hypothetical protein
MSCDEIDDAELFRMLTVHIGEARRVAEALRTWITEYPTPATDSVSH